MAFKAGFIMMSPDGDPKKHRASIKTAKLELTAVVFEFMNFDQAVDVCKELAEKEGSIPSSSAPVFTTRP